MVKLPMCRICLVENVRMYVVVNRSLQEIYEKLTDIPFVTEDRRPVLACFICCTKLKQCWRLLRQCLEAEEQFALMMNEDYEPNPLINQDRLKFYSGFSKPPIEHISIVDECQTESIAIKEELPAVCEGLDDIIELNEEHQSDELELEHLDSSRQNASAVPTHHSESHLEKDVPLMVIKTEVEEEVSLDNSCLDIADIPPQHSESDFRYDVPLIEFITEVEKEVSKKKQTAREMERMPTWDNTREITISDKRKHRVHFSDTQVLALETRFTNQMYLTVLERAQLAATINLSTTQVKNWFQNRRYKIKMNKTPDFKRISKDKSKTQKQKPSSKPYKETIYDVIQPFSSNQIRSTIYFDDSLEYDSQNDNNLNEQVTVDHVGTTAEMQTSSTANVLVNDCKEINKEPEIKKYFPGLINRLIFQTDFGH